MQSRITAKNTGFKRRALSETKDLSSTPTFSSSTSSSGQREAEIKYILEHLPPSNLLAQKYYRCNKIFGNCSLLSDLEKKLIYDRQISQGESVNFDSFFKDENECKIRCGSSSQYFTARWNEIKKYLSMTEQIEALYIWARQFTNSDSLFNQYEWVREQLKNIIRANLTRFPQVIQEIKLDSSTLTNDQLVAIIRVTDIMNSLIATKLHPSQENISLFIRAAKIVQKYILDLNFYRDWFEKNINENFDNPSKKQLSVFMRKVYSTLDTINYNAKNRGHCHYQNLYQFIRKMALHQMFWSGELHNEAKNFPENFFSSLMHEGDEAKDEDEEIEEMFDILRPIFENFQYFVFSPCVQFEDLLQAQLQRAKLSKWGVATIQDNYLNDIIEGFNLAFENTASPTVLLWQLIPLEFYFENREDDYSKLYNNIIFDSAENDTENFANLIADEFIDIDDIKHLSEIYKDPRQAVQTLERIKIFLDSKFKINESSRENQSSEMEEILDYMNAYIENNTNR